MKPNLIEIDGKLYTGPQLAKLAGVVSWSVAYMRLRNGWGVREAFHTPLAQRETHDWRTPKTEALQASIDKHRAAIAWHTKRMASDQRKLDAIDAKESERIDAINAQI